MKAAARRRHIQQPTANPWLEYERRKNAWKAANPTATTAEYAAALTKIAREVGV